MLIPTVCSTLIKVCKMSSFVHSHGENPAWSLSQAACQTPRCVWPLTATSRHCLAHGSEQHHAAFHVFLEIPPGVPGTHMSVCLRVPLLVQAHGCEMHRAWDAEFQEGAGIPPGSAPWLANPGPAKAPADRVWHGPCVAQELGCTLSGRVSLLCPETFSFFGKFSSHLLTKNK